MYHLPLSECSRSRELSTTASYFYGRVSILHKNRLLFRAPYNKGFLFFTISRWRVSTLRSIKPLSLWVYEQKILIQDGFFVVVVVVVVVQVRLRKKYYAPLRPDWGSNQRHPDHDSTFHVPETPVLTTQPSAIVYQDSAFHVPEMPNLTTRPSATAMPANNSSGSQWRQDWPRTPK